MVKETVTSANTEISVQENAEDAGRTFTQAEVDAIVGDRLKRDRAKYADYETLKQKAEKLDALEEQSKTELEKVTERAKALQAELDDMKKAEGLRSMREKVAAEMNVPANLLNADTEEDCVAQANEILKFAKPTYPNVRDAGEAKGSLKGSTRQQFAEWAAQNLS